MSTPISQRENKFGRVPIAFLVLFICIASFFAYFFSLAPIILSMKARGWQETPCVITSSKFNTHRDDSTTYSLNIHYEYTFGGRKYESHGYGVFEVLNSNRHHSSPADVQEIVNQYPERLITVCYVDPQHPEESLLNRKLPVSHYVSFMIWILVFLPIGILYLMLKKPLSTDGNLQAERLESIELKIKRNMPKLRVIGSLFITLVWNGVVSIFLYNIVHEGNVFSVMGLFLIPFILIGIGMIFWVARFVLALFNPRPVLILSSNEVSLGEKFLLEWKVSGRVDWFDRFRVLVEAREEVTYRRGTDTYTDQSIFFSFALVDESASSGMSRSSGGHAEFTVPVGMMHSLDAPNNKIIWCIRIVGEIPRWPDVNEEFEFKVNPFSL